MSLRTLVPSAMIALLIAAAGARTADATSYRFRVTCPQTSLVVEWNTGTIDPGREYLRAQTGTRHQGCQVSDFNGSRDGNLHVERYRGPAAVVRGLPGIGAIFR